jgi:activating signal cointegrator complex subunit 3
VQIDSKTLCSRFSKAKDEGWWVVLGEIDSGELLALKRIGFFSDRTRVSLAFTAPQHSCRKILSVYVISDSYLGLDQQFELSLNFSSD